jgi:hypothetical protein
MIVKPQVLGVATVIHWLKLERKNKLLILLPVIAIFLLSLMLHGFWPKLMYENVHNNIAPKSGISIWPYGIPIGLALLALSIKNRNVSLGGLSTFFLIPYLASHSLFPYTVVLFSIISKKSATVVFVLSWIVALMAT